jgi:hypothetical protein
MREVIDKKAITSGVFAFIIIVILLPLLATFAASFGPIHWIVDYIESTRKFKPILFTLVGVITALRSTRTPIKSSAIVGFIGANLLILISIILGSSNQTYLMASLQYIIFSVGLCGLGALCIVLSKRLIQTLGRK